MHTNVRYVEKRRNKNGGCRWYWIRRGFKSVRLPDDEAAAMARAIELNTLADVGDAPRRDFSMGRGTVTEYVNEYEKSDGFRSLALNTKRGYLREMDGLRGVLGQLPIQSLTRRVVKRYLNTIESVAYRRKARNVLLNVLEAAVDDGEIPINTARGIRLPDSPARKELWLDDDVEAFVDATSIFARSGPMLRLGFTLLLYTGQRINDVLGLRWSSYDGEYITLTQGKTGTAVSIFCHHDLRAALDEAKRAARGVHIVTLSNGRPTSYNNFRQLARKALLHIGREHLQIHDLRRTACTRLAEAGCTESQIASITGHSIERTRKILDIYIVRTKELTKGAILKLEGRNRTQSPTSSPTSVQRAR